MGESEASAITGTDLFDPIQYRRQVAGRRGDGRHPPPPPPQRKPSISTEAAEKSDGLGLHVGFQDDGSHVAEDRNVLCKLEGKSGHNRRATTDLAERAERVPRTAKFVSRPILRTAATKSRASLEPLHVGQEGGASGLWNRYPVQTMFRGSSGLTSHTRMDLDADATGIITSPSRLKLNQALIAPAEWFQDVVCIPKVNLRSDYLHACD